MTLSVLLYINITIRYPTVKTESKITVSAVPVINWRIFSSSLTLETTSPTCHFPKYFIGRAVICLNNLVLKSTGCMGKEITTHSGNKQLKYRYTSHTYDQNIKCS